MNKQGVVISGIGVVSPIGIGIESFWASLLAGQVGIDSIKKFDASDIPCQIAAEVKGFNPRDLLELKLTKTTSYQTQLALCSFLLAAKDAGIELAQFEKNDTDVIVGSSSPSANEIEREIEVDDQSKNFSERKYDPFSGLKLSMSSTASMLALLSNAGGNVSTISTSCASGLSALGEARQRILTGLASTVIVAVAETSVSRIFLNAFSKARLLSTQNQTPSNSVKPFDDDRDGFVLGDGAVVFIVESLSQALSREGAKIYAEVVNCKAKMENMNFLLSPDNTGRKWGALLKEVLDSKIPTYINAHAIGSIAGDEIEMKAFEESLGPALSGVKIVSIKGQVGQGFSAAGAFQLAASCMSIRKGIIPKTVNFNNSTLRRGGQVNTRIRHQKVEQVLVSSHGLGGINAGVLLGKYNG